MKHRNYRRLSGREREEISRGLAAGQTQRDIATVLGRSPGTISWEIKCNSGKSGYRAYILAGLGRRWSPKEIVKRMKMEYPHDEDMRISHEAIYQYVYVLPQAV